MTLSVYLVTYKTDTNPHYPGDPLAFDTRERVVVSGSAESACTYISADLDRKGIKYTHLTAKFHKQYTP